LGNPGGDLFPRCGFAPFIGSRFDLIAAVGI
jgi:hypothetical protein